MPREPKTKLADLPAIPAELLEQFGNGPMTAEAINAATLVLKKALIERALNGEMHHPGYPPGAGKSATMANRRNGTGAKTVLTEDGPITIEVPRDRRQFRAPADSQERTALYGLRRQDRRPVCPGHDRARNPGILA